MCIRDRYQRRVHGDIINSVNQIMAQPSDLPTNFTNQIEEGSNRFQPESRRYHLYVSPSCPYAQTAHIALTLKGLQDHIGLSITHPVFELTKPDVDDHAGWVFKNPTDAPIQNIKGQGPYSCERCIPDTVNNCKSVRELYDLQNIPYAGKYTVPVLWDKQHKVIVNNESAQILRIFNSAFNKIGSNPRLDLYPEHLRQNIEEINQYIVNELTGPISACLFSVKNQEEYNANAIKVFETLDHLEKLLSKSRYLCGNQLTESDVKLFVVLIRFDEASTIICKLNKKRILDYPNLQDYLRDLYQTPGIAETVDMNHIKAAYFSRFDPTGIIPTGPNVIQDLKKQHNRNRFQ
eukprot:TRINITY_DN2619_c0_g1_i6.p1 TRINITY_DN2619_c0_g1~~TRINITY_DN2619_c0_g1_i6.p1  ORF type:complete len:348 (-),score=60.69 TRINITY_DN2619_c0_g1_i6:183-1226(-)